MAFSEPQKNLESLGLSEGSVVADLGAGSGFYSLAAAHLVGGGKVYAVDVQQDLLSRIQNAAHAEHLHNIEVVHGDIENVGGTKIRESSVDAVLVCNVLFQIELKDGLVEEVKRILKKDGRVLIVDWMDSFGGLGPHEDAVYSQPDAQKLFVAHGFVLVRAINAGDHHYGLIYRKA